MRKKIRVGLLAMLVLYGCQKLNAPRGRLTFYFDSVRLDSMQWITIDNDTFRQQLILDNSVQEDFCSDPRYYVELSPGYHTVQAGNGLLTWNIAAPVTVNQCNSVLFNPDDAASGSSNGAVVFSNGGTSGFGHYDISLDVTPVGSLTESIPFGSPAKTLRAVTSAGVHNFLALSPDGYSFSDSLLIQPGKTRYLTLIFYGGSKILNQTAGTILVNFPSAYPDVLVYVNGNYIGTTTEAGTDPSIGFRNYQATYGFYDYGTSTTTTRCFSYSANTADSAHLWNGNACYYETTLYGASQITFN